MITLVRPVKIAKRTVVPFGTGVSSLMPQLYIWSILCQA
jgi:hypothetical protein